MSSTALGASTLRASRRRYGEDIIKGLLALCALVSVATTVGIVFALLLPAIEFFREISIVDYLTGKEWTPLFEPANFGVLPLVGGTMVVTLWACLVAIPLGLGSAIYLSEYARPRTKSFLKPALEVLAGIPTVVFGFFALSFVTPLLRDIGIQVDIFNALGAALVMGVMLIPTVASLSEDAMAAVPHELRDGGLRARVQQAPGLHADRRARRDLGHRGLVRARDFPRRRGNHDRPGRGGVATQPDVRSPPGDGDDDGVHRLDRHG